MLDITHMQNAIKVIMKLILIVINPTDKDDITALQLRTSPLIYF